MYSASTWCSAEPTKMMAMHAIIALHGIAVVFQKVSWCFSPVQAIANGSACIGGAGVFYYCENQKRFKKVFLYIVFLRRTLLVR